jgi:hypothetical protein
MNDRTVKYLMLVIVVVVTVMVVEMTIENGGQWNDCSMRN